MANDRITAVAAEAVATGDGVARATAVAGEAIAFAANPPARVTTALVELVVPASQWPRVTAYAYILG